MESLKVTDGFSSKPVNRPAGVVIVDLADSRARTFDGWGSDADWEARDKGAESRSRLYAWQADRLRFYFPHPFGENKTDSSLNTTNLPSNPPPNLPPLPGDDSTQSLPAPPAF
jgi:hypothetical protein